MRLLESMQVFLRVAEQGSFTAAADSLGRSRASVSSAVQQLESLLGTRLLHRTTRSVQMTQDGQVFYERCRDLLADMDELQNLFREDTSELHGRLRVDMPLPIARDIVIQRLPEFLRQHPRLEVELSSTDRFVDVVREGFDCVLRVGALEDSSLIARPLGYYRMVNCASTEYLAEHGTPRTLDELERHQLIHYVLTLGSHSAGFEYEDPEKPGAEKSQPMRGAVTVNNTATYLDACIAGLGIIQVPEAGVHPYLQSGELEEILPQYRPAPMPVSLVYAHRRHLPKRVQVFMAWVAEIMKPRLVDERGERLS
ncbi:DNA-binding transcriptional regulator, LysR family [Microbulbifer donghaiensis]|uniref:DNA-binding transcriptional regulator, LysR family n=1 Tax=Microbulbifer donghaiensis TaxID=494016 RepID=A0A1M4X3M7_9GAMM|nr:LysR family transcriptional regulator [Microbulbifer donghaiensis]SHE88104.1 DNA-binding transcriptional regulator, LysR family [Microbulbifer donghaiensis]